jgi:hypothetical protein
MDAEWRTWEIDFASLTSPRIYAAGDRLRQGAGRRLQRSQRRFEMRALLGCEHCGNLMRRLHEGDVENCARCGKGMREMGLLEARTLSREARIAEQFRRTAGLRGATFPATMSRLG